MPEDREYKTALLDDQTTLLQWADKERSKLIASFEDATIRDDDVDTLEFNELIHKDPFLLGQEVRPRI